MTEKLVHLILAVFSGAASAQTAMSALPKRDSTVASSVIVQKDGRGRITYRDVGLTPGKGTVEGVVIGGVIGLLTGGTSLALGVLGGLVGHRAAKKRQVKDLVPAHMNQVAASLGPDSSAIIAVSERPLGAQVTATLTGMGAELYEVVVPPETFGQLGDQADEMYATLLEALAQSTGGEPMLTLPYPRIHVVVNPASGKDKPIINILNRVFNRYGVDWDVSITRKYGDATAFARRAATNGYDLVAGYGGDGTEIEPADHNGQEQRQRRRKVIAVEEGPVCMISYDRNPEDMVVAGEIFGQTVECFEKHQPY